jgi:hypothetical protein
MDLNAINPLTDLNLNYFNQCKQRASGQQNINEQEEMEEDEEDEEGEEEYDNYNNADGEEEEQPQQKDGQKQPNKVPQQQPLDRKIIKYILGQQREYHYQKTVKSLKELDEFRVKVW